MKVLYIGGEALATGASFSMAKLVEEEEKLGLEVIPVVHKGNTDMLLKEQGKTHYIVNAWSWMVKSDMPKAKVLTFRMIKEILNIPCYIQYKRIIRREKPDIVHVNALTTYVGAKAAISCGKPLVWHIREMMEEDLNGCFWSKKQAYSLMKKATCFIAISKCVEKKFCKIVGTEKIHCIYNGVDRNIYYNPNHKVLCRDSIVITMAGRITHEKGQYQCLKSLVPVLKANPNVVLQFAGTGKAAEIEKLNNLRIQEGLSESQVRFLGFVKDMAPLWADTDIAIIYSRFEAFGRVTVEAKMAGALVVGYDSGGTSELISNGEDGYLFDNDKLNLTTVIKSILSNKTIASQVAKNGRKKAAAIYTSQNNAKQIRCLYQEIIRNT